MTQEEFDNHPGWRWSTFQGARDSVLLMGLKTSFREKLEWLEEAETLFLRMQESRGSRSTSGSMALNDAPPPPNKTDGGTSP
jgi:hypothetical protein